MKFEILNGGTRSGAKPWFSIVDKGDSGPAEVKIYGQIGKDYFSNEGVDAKEFSEALDSLSPNRDRALAVHMHSPGGNVFEGANIYNNLMNWNGRVDTFNDGICASICSLIMLAAHNGGKVHAAKISQTMIHDPSTIAAGTSKDMQEAIDALESCKKIILSAYHDKTKIPTAQLSAMMEKTTWMTGPEAKEKGFVDVITADAAIQNTFDFSAFENVPEDLRNPQNSAAPQGGGTPPNQLMKREEIIALLKEHGVEVDDKSTLEQLQAKLKEALKAKAPDKKTETPTAAVPGESAPVADALNRLENRYKEMEARYEAQRKLVISEKIDAAIGERQIVAADRQYWIDAAMKDEKALEVIARMPSQKPDASIVTIPPGSDSISDVTTHLTNLAKSIHHEAIADIDRKSAIAAQIAKTRASYIRKHQNKIAEVWNTNTIPAQLQQDVIVDLGLRAFKRVLFPLTRFCTLLSNVPLRGTNTVEVPFIDLETGASTSFNPATGYAPGNTVITYRPVTIDQRYYQGLAFTSSEIARQPFLWIERQMTIKGEKLAYDVWGAGIGLLTVANGYSVAAGWPLSAGAMDSNAVNALRVNANTAQWSPSGRFMVTNAAYDGQLAQDNAIKLALNIGGTEVLREGRIPNIYGFDYFTNALLPNNGINLAGFIATQSAAIIAQAPIPPVEEVLRAGTMYSMAVDPDTGATLEYRSFGSNVLDRGERYIECNYGFGKGNAAAAQLLTTP